MSNRRPLVTLTVATFAAFLMGVSPLASAADTAQKRALAECVNRDLTTNQFQFEISALQLTTIRQIVDAEIMKFTPTGSATDFSNFINTIKVAIRNALPVLTAQELEEITVTVKEKTLHCMAS